MTANSGLDGSSRETLENLHDQGYSDEDLFHLHLLILISMFERFPMLDIIHLDRDE